MNNLGIFNAPEGISIGFKSDEPAPRVRKKKEILMTQVSLKLHPDIIKAVAAIAQKQRKMPAEVMRDLILKALIAEGKDL